MYMYKYDEIHKFQVLELQIEMNVHMFLTVFFSTTYAVVRKQAWIFQACFLATFLSSMTKLRRDKHIHFNSQF